MLSLSVPFFFITPRVGAFCSSYSYGLEYTGFTANPFSQGVVLAHEMGHNLVRLDTYASDTA